MRRHAAWHATTALVAVAMCAVVVQPGPRSTTVTTAVAPSPTTTTITVPTTQGTTTTTAPPTTVAPSTTAPPTTVHRVTVPRTTSPPPPTTEALPAPPAEPGPGGATQEVVVVAPSYGSSSGTMTAYELEGDAWVVVAGPARAELGRRGLSGSRHEGDLTTPIGTFGFGSTMYGLGGSLNDRYRYHALECGDWWSGEPDDTYNTFVQQPCEAAPLPSSEALWEQTTAYQHLAVISFNTGPVEQGRGSGIFLHDDTPSGVTAGCVALAPSVLDAVLSWLDPAKHPVIRIGTAHEVGPP